MNKKKLFAAALAGVTLTLAFVGAEGSPVGAAQAPATTAPLDVRAPVLTPPKPTKDDKPMRGKVGQKGAPPAADAGASVSTLSSCATTCYFYSGAVRDPGTGTKDGVAANMRIAKPTKDAVDFHSLGEIAAIKTIGGKRQIVEVGWNVDRGVNGDLNPHLFVYHWVNDQPSAYNGAGWVDYAPNPLNAGADISADIGTQQGAGILHFGSAWWISYKGSWVGYFPDSLWTSAGVSGFTNTTYQNVFGEIAASHDPSCTDMGNGYMASATGTYPVGGASMGSLNTYVGTTPTLDTYTGTTVSKPTKWGYVALSGSTFRYGGPGDTVCP